MSGLERPNIATYEPVGAPAEEQELVERPMTDEELAQWEADVAAARELEAEEAAE